MKIPTKVHSNACITTRCGNYDEQYRNHCRAFVGRLTFDVAHICPGYCSFAKAAAVDRESLLRCQTREEYEALRQELASRVNPDRPPAAYPPWEA